MKTDLNVFNYLNYKDFLKDLFSPENSPRGLQSKMARHLNCQAAYLYQVLRGKGDITDDQAFKVTDFLQLDPNPRDYFLLQVRHSRAALPELKSFLFAEMKKIKAAEMTAKNNSDAEEPNIDSAIWDYYFSSVTPSLIHILTSNENFQTSETLAKKIKRPIAEVKAHLEQLQQFNLVVKKGNRYIYASPSIHFDKKSKYNHRLQILRRIQSLSALESNNQEEHIHFSTLFTIDRESYEALRKNMFEFIKKSQKTIHSGGTDEAYILNLDLFSPVTSDQ